MAGTTDITYGRELNALIPSESSDDPDLIRRQIEHTRTQLGVTIQEIGERLSPENLLEQAKSSAREATVGRIKDMKNEANRKVEGVGNNLSQTIRDNPLPVAVIGLGLGWLLLSERNKRDAYGMENYPYRGANNRYYYDEANDESFIEDARQRVSHAASAVGNRTTEIKNRVTDVVQDAGDAVTDVASNAGEAVGDTAQRAGETISDAASRVSDSVTQTAGRIGETAEKVQERAGEVTSKTMQEADRLRHEAEWRSRMAVNRTRQSFWHNMEENPLAVGAILAVAGAAVGAAIPASEYENKLLGETRDRLVDEAKVRAQDVVERVQSVVDETQRAVVTEAKDAARRQNLTIDDMIGEKEDTY